MLVLEPIFEADLQPEQYAYRPGRSTHDALRRVHHLLITGHNEVVDCDLANYFGEIPHAELLRSLARRIGDERISVVSPFGGTWQEDRIMALLQAKSSISACGALSLTEQRDG